MTAPVCQHCGGSLAGKRRDAKFCSARCRISTHRRVIGRVVEEVATHYVIDKSMRDALIESYDLNPQDERDPEMIREAFKRMCERFTERFA